MYLNTSRLTLTMALPRWGSRSFGPARERNVATSRLRFLWQPRLDASGRRARRLVLHDVKPEHVPNRVPNSAILTCAVCNQLP